MRATILIASILSAATAFAETTIVEYPDHYYVESTGTPGSKPAAVPQKQDPGKVVAPIIADEISRPAEMVRPVTNFDRSPLSVPPDERRAAIVKTIQRLQLERSDLTTPKDGETAEQIARRERDALGKQRRINKLESELLKIPAQNFN